jgi:predicted Zn-ribbon and HTH transcriptional regulator
LKLYIGGIMEIKEKIINLLKNSEPLRCGEIAEMIEEEKKDVEKAIKVLKKENKIISPKRCYCSVEKP